MASAVQLFFSLVGVALVLASCSACIIGAIDHPRRDEPMRVDGGAP